jgi:hypothetical protein
VSVNCENLASSVKAIFSTNPFESRIPIIVHVDMTIKTLVHSIKDTCPVNEDHMVILTLLIVMPGSSKTPSVKELASLAGAKHIC